MNTGQDWRDQQAPEVVNQNYPEAVPAPNYHHNFLPQQYPQPHQTQGYALSKAEDGTGTYASSNTPYHVPFAAPAAALPGPGEKANNDGKRTGVCGASTVVIVLSAIIAALFVAVVGLAAGTGVEANRANVAEAQVRSMSAAASTVAAKTVTATAAAAAATITSLDALDAGCSTNAAGVSGSTYGAFALIGGDRSFTLQCNADAVGSPLLKLFASDIHTCMDACAAFSQDTPSSFGSNSNTTCGGVSFIPAWTNKTVALAGTAPGNCYLKPIQTSVPNIPNIGTECHAGILVT